MERSPTPTPTSIPTPTLTPTPAPTLILTPIGGSCSDEDPSWTPSLREALRHEAGADKGAFWIEIGDLMRYFSHVDVCKVSLSIILLS